MRYPLYRKMCKGCTEVVLKDGTVPETGFKAYSKNNIHIYKLFKEFETEYINKNMTEKD